MTIAKLKTKPKLRIVAKTHRPVDITALIRAEIQERDWERVHVQGQRNPPLDLPDRPKGRWFR